MRIVNKIEVKTSQMPRRKRVAAYARVSMESERLQHSLSAQVSLLRTLLTAAQGILPFLLAAVLPTTAVSAPFQLWALDFLMAAAMSLMEQVKVLKKSGRSWPN